MKHARIAATILAGAFVLASCETEPDKPTGKNPGAKPVGMLDADHNYARDKGLENLYGGVPSWWSDSPRVEGSTANVCAVGTAGKLSVAYDLALRNAKASGREAMHVTPQRVEVERAGVSRTPGGSYVVRMLTRCEGPGASLALAAPVPAPTFAASTAVPTPVVAEANPPVPTAQPVPGDLTETAPGWFGAGTTFAEGRCTVAVRRDARTLVEARRLVLDAGRDELNQACGGEAKDVRTLQTAAQRLGDGTWRAYASMSAAEHAEASAKAHR